MRHQVHVISLAFYQASLLTTFFMET